MVAMIDGHAGTEGGPAVAATANKRLFVESPDIMISI